MAPFIGCEACDDIMLLPKNSEKWDSEFGDQRQLRSSFGRVSGFDGEVEP
jgi:hypothetical protein